MPMPTHEPMIAAGIGEVADREDVDAEPAAERGAGPRAEAAAT